MSQSKTLKQSQHAPERVVIETTRAQGKGISTSAGAASVAQSMGWTIGQAADFLQSGREPITGV